MPRSLGSERYIAEIENAFLVERQLLERLGVHPRIVRYHGPHRIKGMKDGFLLDEANCGDLQSCIDRDNGGIDGALRKKWTIQIAKAVAHVHKMGIVHSNLSTTNVLVHQTGLAKDLVLADFGGAKCQELNLDGELLPDDPFFDPNLTEFNSPKVDVFSLGVVIYIIITGHYPFHQGPAPQNKERFAYGDYVQTMFGQGKFPNLSGVPFGDVIAGCCCERRFENANEVVKALEDAEMRYHSSWRSKLLVAHRSQFLTVLDCVLFLVWVAWGVWRLLARSLTLNTEQ